MARYGRAVPRPKPVLAVVGGSFNPPHVGHALLPRYLLSTGEVDAVLVCPCADHPLGKRLTPFARRMSWTRLALAPELRAGGGSVIVSAIEGELAAARDGRPSYSLELLEAIAARYPGHRVRLVVGSDIIESGETERWHRWSDIVAGFEPIVVPRAGWCEAGSASLPEVSSTVVREQLDRLRRHVADGDAAGAAKARSLLERQVPRAVAEALQRWIAGGEPRVWVVGLGHVAHHAVPWLWDRGFCVETIGARALVEGAQPGATPLELPAIDEGPPAGVWILARDGALSAVAEALAGRLPPGVPVLHGAGAKLASEVLAPLAAAGHPVGSLHPICSLRKEREGSRLRHAGFGIGGHAQAHAFARTLVGEQRWLDLRSLDAEGRLAYHGACALVANHQAVLQVGAAEVLATLVGASESATARAALGDLMLGSLENLLALGVPAGVTGPLSRGDTATVAAHVEALRGLGDTGAAAGELYASLSARLAELLGPRAAGSEGAVS